VVKLQLATSSSAFDAGLTDVGDEQVTCMAEGHAWPKLRLNRRVPHGVRLYPNADGTFQLVYVCEICGTERTRTTLPRGVYDASQAYSYVYPRTWVHFTAGDDMSRGRIKTELSKRMFDTLLATSKAEGE
jgi:hypothetical protein